MVRSKDHKRQVEILTLPDHTWHGVSVEPGWENLGTVAWAADGNGFFVSYFSANNSGLLYVTLAGKVKLLLRRNDFHEIVTIMPSPDGRYLAYGGETRDSNVWMLENF
jgi:hypothetical protein